MKNIDRPDILVLPATCIFCYHYLYLSDPALYSRQSESKKEIWQIWLCVCWLYEKGGNNAKCSRTKKDKHVEM